MISKEQKYGLEIRHHLVTPEYVDLYTDVKRHYESI